MSVLTAQHKQLTNHVLTSSEEDVAHLLSPSRLFLHRAVPDVRDLESPALRK